MLSVACTACQANFRLVTYISQQPSYIDPVSSTPLTHVPGCSKCSRPHKGHPLPYGANCALALAEEHADESGDIPAWGVEGPAVPTQPGLSALDEPPAVDNTAPVPAEHCIEPQDRATQQKMASLITTMTTITTGAPTECSLAVLSTRLGQQDEQSAKDRCQIDELSQQLSDTTTQLAHISKVLDHLLTSHTPTATLADVPAAPSTSAGNGAVPSGAASSLLQQGTAFSKIHSTVSSFHINGQAAPTQPCRGLAGPSRSCPDTGPQQHLEPLCQAILLLRFLDTGSSEPGCPCPRPTSRPELATTPTGYNHCGTVRDPTAQHLGWPLYSNIRLGLVTLLAMGPLLGISQTTTNATSMAKDTATMANVIPYVPLKLQQKIIQGEFIDLSELLQADFQFKYASIDPNNAFELVHKDETMLLWPRKKCRQIDCLNM